MASIDNGAGLDVKATDNGCISAAHVYLAISKRHGGAGLDDNTGRNTEGGSCQHEEHNDDGGALGHAGLPIRFYLGQKKEGPNSAHYCSGASLSDSILILQGEL